MKEISMRSSVTQSLKYLRLPNELVSTFKTRMLLKQPHIEIDYTVTGLNADNTTLIDLNAFKAKDAKFYMDDDKAKLIVTFDEPEEVTDGIDSQKE